ncbi:MAG: acylneuraminate cytidylyltransferase family protein [Nitrospiraceae bacterium]|nr:acylneuraminate cytidylyltransferase family protein [Nitrospiraceae bacterium]
MIGGKTVLAIIPARGGSKGVPRKNIRMVAGKPLIAWTIEAAKKSRYIDRCILSSEDAEIIQVAKEWGCEVPFVRPAELSQDDTPGVDPVIHAVQQVPGYDYAVLLQPTSPLRRVEDIDGCVALCVTKAAPACVTVTEPDKSPFWMFTVDTKGIMHKLIPSHDISRRQDLPKVYALNGAVYVIESSRLIQERSFLPDTTLAYRMEKQYSLDIDSEMDVMIAEALMKNGRMAPQQES